MEGELRIMEIKISQDLRKFKTKDIGNFSLKEAGYITLALGSGFAVYKLTEGSLELALVPVTIILIIGFFKPFGLSFFEFARTVLLENLFSPRQYIWETDHEYDPNGFEKLYGEKIAIPSSWNAIHAEHTKVDKKEAKLESSQLIG